MKRQPEPSPLTLCFGEEPYVPYSMVHRLHPVSIARGQHAILITNALFPKGALELGRIFEKDSAWVFEDSAGVQTRFIPGDDVKPFDATWGVEHLESDHPEPAIRDLHNSDQYRRRRLFYGAKGEMPNFRPQDSEVFGREWTPFPNGLTDPSIDNNHFGIGLKRDGSVFVHDIGSTNGTFISVQDASVPFGSSDNRKVDFPHGTKGTVFEVWAKEYLEKLWAAFLGGASVQGVDTGSSRRRPKRIGSPSRRR